MRINLRGYFNDLSYGVVTKNILKSLNQLGYEVGFFPISQPQISNKEEYDLLTKLLPYSQFFDNNAPCINIHHQFFLAESVGKGLRIGFPFFELDTFTDVEKHHLNSQDYLFTPSKWGKSILLNNGVLSEDKIFVAPLGTDSEIFHPQEYPLHDSTVFLTIGKHEERKNHLILVEAFNNAFTKDDRVELWLMAENPFYTKEQTEYWHKAYKETPLGDKITFLPRCQTQQEINTIINTSDCGVYPDRGEAWGLSILDTMACGKKIITTRYGGHTEYCSDDNAMLINVDSVEPAYDLSVPNAPLWFTGQGCWSSFGKNQFDQLVEYMKQIYKDKQKGVLYNSQGLETAQHYSWSNTVQIIVNILQSI
jgi:glycosyltransferase involved in cell wall biosynthesis